MQKILIRLLQVVLIILTLFLVLSTFFPQVSQMTSQAGEVSPLAIFFRLNNFYNSALNIILWVLLALLLLLTALTGAIEGTAQKLVHVLLALSFFVVIYEKSVNQRFYIELIEQQTIQFSDYIEDSADDINLSIHLDKFEIERHAGSRMPSAFISHLVLNESDTVQLAVNKPLKYRHYRFYQNAYDRKIICNLKIDQQTYSMAVKDTLRLEDDTMVLGSFDHESRSFDLIINGEKYQARPGEKIKIDGKDITINPQGTKYISILEVAEVKGTGILLILSIIYLLFLLIAHKEEGKNGS